MSINLNCEKGAVRKTGDTTDMNNNTNSNMNNKSLKGQKTISSLISLSKVPIEKNSHSLFSYVKVPSKYILYSPNSH